jgi:hypothetical protein
MSVVPATYSGSCGRRIIWTQEFEASQGNTVRPHLKNKTTLFKLQAL